MSYFSRVIKPAIKRFFFWFILFLLLVIGYQLLQYRQHWVEMYYSNGIYLYISQFFRILLGWIPFSVGDLIYVFSGFYLFIFIFKNRRVLIPLSRKRAPLTLQFYTTLIKILFFTLLWFILSWGLNYHRLPIAKTLGIPSSLEVKTLVQTTEHFAQMSNSLHEELQNDPTKKVYFHQGHTHWYERASQTTAPILSKPESFTNQSLSVKKSLLSTPLSFMGYSGYLNPFTGEAHTNKFINNYKTPVLVLHEMAHQMGYAKENEANFFAITTGLKHKDPYFKYSASIFGLRYLLSNLYQIDPEAAAEINRNLRPGIFENYRELKEFWEPYRDNPLEDISHKVYDQYLKANSQPGGLKTYSYVVQLLTGCYDAKKDLISF